VCVCVLAGAREVLEETGVRVATKSLRVLCLWESVYAPSVKDHSLSSHHVIVFLSATAADKTPVLRPQPEEVRVWVKLGLGLILLEC